MGVKNEILRLKDEAQRVSLKIKAKEAEMDEHINRMTSFEFSPILEELQSLKEELITLEDELDNWR